MIRCVYPKDHFGGQVSAKGEETESKRTEPTLMHIPKYSNDNVKQG